MEDTLFAVLFCGACMFCLDHLGLWKDVVLKTAGTDLYTHHFLITYLVNNAAFFPFALFLARYDLRNSKGKVQKIIANLYRVTIQVVQNLPLTLI